MRIREYKESDLDALRRMHTQQGFDYTFPDLANPLFVSKLVVEDDDGRAVMASLARLTCEMYLLVAPGEGKPRERYERLLALHNAGERDLLARGLHDAHAWLPPPIAKNSAAALRRWAGFATTRGRPTAAVSPCSFRMPTLVPDLDSLLYYVSRGDCMPFINGRFYMNPAYGRALEAARAKDLAKRHDVHPFARQDLIDRYGESTPENTLLSSEQDGKLGRQDLAQNNGHWVTIDGHHVLIEQESSQRSSTDRRQQSVRKSHLSARDKSYLDKYCGAVAVHTKKYNVDPALVLGLGIESGFGSGGTYLRTGDAFGMTGGSTKRMTTAASADENVRQFFDNYGNQIRGTGSDASLFINGLQGRNASGDRVKGWKVYNIVNPRWENLVHDGINTMRKDIPTYLSQKKAEQSR